jgi:hypothetical protein
MTSVVTGGCLCGNVRYDYAGAVGPATYCHCADCRKCTGSAFNIGVRVEVRQFRIVKGNPKGFTKQGDSGNELTRHFCPDCGSPLYTSSPRHPDFFYVKAGSLDDPAIVRPVQQIWTSSMVPWATISQGLPGYPKGRG